jgi:hypothetical protein
VSWLLLAIAVVVIAVLANRAFIARRNMQSLSEELDELAINLHDTYCRAGDWPDHEGECVAFEGYEVVANPLLSILASHGFADRADVERVAVECRCYWCSRVRSAK